ncbi:hypothetical protein HPB49_025049 [Dermacentor silvarum]|uniref:Uncharacterized protein n=1 Tax=Dermacentor silvarum TaxID=543639 RepID=A0ACB8CTN4_DERSI|nr:hypothetical protein HPB49_025049 [Dermacentor silvarum]
MPGNYTLICVFEALRQVLWNKSYTCTDYVYIRFFTYSHDNDPTVQVVFEKKKLKSGLVKMYYDDSAEEWRQYSYRALDNRVRTAIGRHPGTRWFLGLWGSAYMRLMSGLFHASVVQKALHDALRSNFSDKVNMSYFHGFAIINSIIRDTRPLGRSFNFSDIFRGHTHGTPILDPSWSLIHTAAIFPFGPAVVPESMVKHILEEADLVGISTANTTDEPNLLMDNVENTAPYLFASPPNPIMPPGPNTRGMLDILKEFPHWKNVLNRSRLCFSVTTSINYAHTDVDGIDFVRDVRQNEDVQRYSRRRFVAFNATTKLPVEKKLMVYHYDNVTHTHYWRRLPPGEKLLSFFAYDMAETLKYKVEYCIRVAVHCLTYASSSLFVVSAEGALCDQLRDYAVDLNPYRKTLEVFLMLSMLTTCLGVAGYCILSYLIVEYFFASGGLLHVAETEMEVCTDDACGEYEHRTMGFVDWKGSPCENYFKYACSGFQKEAVDLNFAVYRPHNEVVDIEYGILIELLFQDGSDQWPSKVLELHNTARQAYRLCRASEGLHGDLIKELYSAKSRGVNYVISKFERLHPIWCFYTPLVGDGNCYLFPPVMFVPVTVYKSDDFLEEFVTAFLEHLKDNGLEDTPEVRSDIDFFVDVEKKMAELSAHPKRRLYKPVERPTLTGDLNKLLSSDIIGCKGKPYVWANEDHYNGVKDLIDKMENSSLTLYIIMWSIQTFSIAGKENTPLARLHYRYVELLYNPPPAERRCIDYLEPMLRQYYLDHLRITHVYQRDDLPRKSQMQAKQAMKRLVQALKGFLEHSALADADVTKASSLLDGVKFELFYPGKFTEPGFSDAHYAVAFAAPASAVGGQRLDAFRSLVGPFVSRSPELNTGPFSIPVYGLKLLRELFKVIDYRAQWWVGKGSATEAAYQGLEDCVKDLEQIYQIAKEPVERYETIAEIAAVHVLYKMYTEEVQINKRTAVDVRLPFLRTVHSTTQFFVALASVRASSAAYFEKKVSVSTSSLSLLVENTTMELLANHMPQYTEHFGCYPSQRMHFSRRYTRCLFWRR